MSLRPPAAWHAAGVQELRRGGGFAAHFVPQLLHLGLLKTQSFKYKPLATRQAFKNYDEAGALRRIQCLKYLVLATMLMESDVDPFDAQARPIT